MTCPLQGKCREFPVLFVAMRLAICKRRADAAEVAREFRNGKMRLNLRENLGPARDRSGLLADRLCHRHQDPVDLGLLFVQKAHQFVVLLDRLHGLDEHSLAG